MSDAIDDDLRDVFRLLYDGDEWAFDDEDEEGQGAAMDGPDGRDASAQVDRERLEGAPSDPIDASIVDGTTAAAEVEMVEAEVVVPSTQERYTRKRFLDSLSSLLSHTPSPAKHRRIFSASAISYEDDNLDSSRIPSQPQSAPSTALIPSTSTPPPLPHASTYAPFSPPALLARLRTFRPALYPAHLPPELRPAPLALAGWVAGGSDELVCASAGKEGCAVRWSVMGVHEIADERVRREVGRRMGAQVREGHAKGCAWRVKMSPDGLLGQLRRQWHPPIASSLAPLAVALEAECGARGELGRLRWTSPLSAMQLKHVRASLARHIGSHTVPTTTATASPASSPAVAKESESPTSSPPSPSAPAAALALFAWYPLHPNAAPGTVPPLASSTAASASASASASTNASPSDRASRTDIVQCRMCERRVGLWTFISEQGGGTDANGRVFDILQEHLEWCPVRQTVSIAGANAGAGAAAIASNSATEAERGGGDGLDTGTEAGWWAGLSLLRGARQGDGDEAGGVASGLVGAQGEAGTRGTADASVGSTAAFAPTPTPTATPPRGWVAVSDRLERKPWRR